MDTPRSSCLSVNYHLCSACTMKCRYCFSKLARPAGGTAFGSLPKEETLRLTRVLARFAGKLTFVGGEPTLCPWLDELLLAAKQEGCTTMLVTNGSRLSPETLGKLAGTLDWLGLSIDSARPATMEALGRSLGGKALPNEHYLGLAQAAHGAGIKLKINTVVTSLNQDEDMSALVLGLGPRRWKVLQALALEDQNREQLARLAVSDGAFQAFVQRHDQVIGDGVQLVAEDNAAMTGSYLMVDPAGRFFDNTTGSLRFSSPILERGLEQALSEVAFSEVRFRERGGQYDWSGQNS